MGTILYLFVQYILYIIHISTAFNSYSTGTVYTHRYTGIIHTHIDVYTVPVWIIHWYIYCASVKGGGEGKTLIPLPFSDL